MIEKPANLQSVILTQPPSRPPLKKILLALLGLVVLVLIGEGTYFYFTTYKKPLEMLPEKPPEETVERKWIPISPFSLEGPAPKNNLEIAEKVLAWLEEQKDELGVYYSFRLFDSVGSRYKVVPAGTSGHIGMAPIWGRFKHYQVSGDKNDLKILTRDLDTYTDKDKIMSIQNDFWNCSLMFELWQSDSFSEEQKERIKNICWESAYYYPPDLDSVIKEEFIDGRWQDIIETEIEELDLKKAIDKSISFEKPLLANDDRFLSEYTSHPSDFVARYFWEKDENDLKKAKFYFNKAVQLLVQKEELFKGKEICMLGVSASDIFGATQKKDYLDFSLFLFEKVKRDSNQLRQPICAFFAQKLFEATKEPQYRDSQKNILQALVDEAFDFPNYGGYMTGDGAFRLIEENGSVGISKSIRENGLIVGLLAKE